MKQIKPNYQNAQKQALCLLERYDIKVPTVPVIQLAKEEGLKLKFVDMRDEMPNVSGLFDDENRIIYVNKNDSVTRKAFTIAHELGHYILQHETDEFGVLPRQAGLVTANPIEKEANAFAANLLVPKFMLLNVMRKYDLTVADTDSLADMFGVSREVIMYRMNGLM